MTYQEMMDKTKCRVAGFVRGVVEYQGKDKMFYSVDVDVKGCRMPLNLRLPSGYQISSIQVGSVQEFSVIPRLNFAKNGLELHVV